jgi:hypothetical protein
MIFLCRSSVCACVCCVRVCINCVCVRATKYSTHSLPHPRKGDSLPLVSEGTMKASSSTTVDS